MKRKGTMIYLTDHEKNLFTEHAEKYKKSISSWVRDCAIANIASSNIVPLQSDNTEVIQLKQRIEFLEEQLTETLPKDHIKRMTAKIYRAIKNDWINVNQLSELFEINSEEDSDDFNIALHEFQDLYLGDDSEFEFNSFKNAYRRKPQ